MGKTLRIVSLNTWKNEGFYESRLKAIASGLEELSPDIALLQECFVCESSGDDTVSYLAERLGMKSAVAWARRKRRMHRGEMRDTCSSLAVLAREEPSDSMRIPLPTSVEGGERIALSVRVTAKGRRVRVLCVHCSHIGNEKAMRTNQIVASIEAMRADRDADLSILGGDFNCEADSRELQDAMGFAGEGLINALESAGCREATSRMPLPASGKGRQIDQIWYGGLNGGSNVLALAGVAMNRPGSDGVYASDHAAVWADIDIA